MNKVPTQVDPLDPAELNLQAYKSRLDIYASPRTEELDTFAQDVRDGLTAECKTLPCKHLYDHQGSRLFERICGLSEYYLTRTEEQILKRNAKEMVANVNGTGAMTELGAGSALKTDVLIGEFLDSKSRFLYNPIDISREMIRMCAERLLGQHETLNVIAFICDYDSGLVASRLISQPKVYAFLGSSIGNFTREESLSFLQSVTGVMQPEDWVLLGLDMEKDSNVLERAYDDSEGVTAAFSKNLLARINRQLGGEFEMDRFEHRARYNAEEARVEMFLISRATQTVPIRDLELDVSFQTGEATHTEDSHKFTPSIIDSICGAAGLRVVRFWCDPQDWFRVVLLKRNGD